jgi:hypothetical protein
MKMPAIAYCLCYIETEMPGIKMSATGFFYKHKGELHLVTNRHVVFDPKLPGGGVFRATQARLFLQPKPHGIGAEMVEIPLWDASDNIVVRTPNNQIDVAAIPNRRGELRRALRASLV